MTDTERCPTCDGHGEVAAGFGVDSPGRPHVRVCPACGGTGRVPHGGAPVTDAMPHDLLAAVALRDPVPDDDGVYWLVVPVAKELLPQITAGVPASFVRLQPTGRTPREYDLIVTTPEESRDDRPDTDGNDELATIRSAIQTAVPPPADDSILTGYVVIAEWAAGGGDRWLTKTTGDLNDDGPAIWTVKGWLWHALETAQRDADHYYDEDDDT